MKKYMSYFLVLAVSLFGIWSYFSRADYEIASSQISRSELIDIASEVASTYGFEYSEYDIEFFSDQQYISYSYYLLDKNDIKGNRENYGLYYDYWKVRFFIPGYLDTFTVKISLSGDVIGFDHNIPRDVVIKDEGSTKSLEIAENYINNMLTSLNIDPSLLESADLNIYKNEGHTVYKLDKNSSYKIEGELPTKLTATVIGDRVTAITPVSAVVPSSFNSWILNFTKDNSIFHSIAWALFIILYGSIIVLFIYFLFGERRFYLCFNRALLSVSLLISILIAISSYGTKYIGIINSRFINFLIELSSSIPLALLYIFFLIININLAVWLDEKAFPNNISFTNIFNRAFLASNDFFHLIFKGYLVGISSLFLANIFERLSQYFNWISGPRYAGIAFGSNLLPAVNSFTLSLLAGLGEEVVFRIIPLALVFWLTKSLKKHHRYLAIVSVILAQTIMFGSLHVNYPQWPFYSRIVELIIPSIIFALAYINHGFFVGFIAHYVYDFILFSAPIVANLYFLGIYQIALLTFIFLLPFFLFAIFRYFVKEPSVKLNKDMKFDKGKDIDHISENNIKRDYSVDKIIKVSIIVAGAMAMFSIFRSSHFNKQSLKNIDQSRVIEEAVIVMKELGFELENPVLLTKHSAASERNQVKALLLGEGIKNRRRYEKYDSNFDNRLIVISKNGDKSIRVFFNKKAEFIGYNILYKNSDAMAEESSLTLDQAKERAISILGDYFDIYEPDFLSEESTNVYSPEDSNIKRVDRSLSFRVEDKLRYTIKFKGDFIKAIILSYDIYGKDRSRLKLKQSLRGLVSKLALSIYFILLFFLITYFLFFHTIKSTMYNKTTILMALFYLAVIVMTYIYSHSSLMASMDPQLEEFSVNISIIANYVFSVVVGVISIYLIRFLVLEVRKLQKSNTNSSIITVLLALGYSFVVARIFIVIDRANLGDLGIDALNGYHIWPHFIKYAIDAFVFTSFIYITTIVAKYFKKNIITIFLFFIMFLYFISPNNYTGIGIDILVSLILSIASYAMYRVEWVEAPHRVFLLASPLIILGSNFHIFITDIRFILPTLLMIAFYSTLSFLMLLRNKN